MLPFVDSYLYIFMYLYILINIHFTFYFFFSFFLIRYKLLTYSSKKKIGMIDVIELNLFAYFWKVEGNFKHKVL